MARFQLAIPTHGQDLNPVLRDAKAKGRGFAPTQVSRVVRKNKVKKTKMGYSIRTHRDRYTLWNEGEDDHEL